MKKLITLLIIIFLSACSGVEKDCDLLTISVGSSEVIWNPEPNVQIRFLAASFTHSHTHFKCSAWWEGPPLVEGAPTGLITELCVGGRCEKVDGGLSEFKVWSEDWYDLKHYEAAYCIVYMPSWDRDLQYGDPITYPERVIKRVRYPLSFQCKTDGEEDITCHEGYYGPEGWICTQWD